MTQQTKSECCDKCYEISYMVSGSSADVWCSDTTCPCHTTVKKGWTSTPEMIEKVVAQANEDQRATVAKANAIQAEDWEKRFDQYVREVVNDLGTGEIHYFGAKTEHKNGWLIASTDWVHVKDFIRQIRQEAYEQGRQKGLQEALEVLPEERGTEEQVATSGCGLYHWNECRQIAIANITKLLKETEV